MIKDRKPEHDLPLSRTRCPSCGSRDTNLFHRVASAPVNSVLNIRSREEALRFPRGELDLAFCARCGFIYNARFEPEKVRYSSDCEESQGSSPTFNAFSRSLAEKLVEKYNLHGKRILEIGCGKGDFLKLLCRLGANSGVGFDPAFVPGRGEENDSDGAIEFIQDYYSEKYSDFTADMICCRMTLEHIPDTARLMETVRLSIGNRSNTVLFFQVPNVARILRDCAFEDIYYEHCSYFSLGSLARLFRNCHFDVLDLKMAYGEQYLLIEARPAVDKKAKSLRLENDLSRVEDLVGRFHRQFPSVVDYWRSSMESLRQQKRRAVLWGSGSKGVTFLNTLENSEVIEYVVDISPYRQGTFMAGTGQPIVGPVFLRSYKPDVVIVMNPMYREEILRDLREMGLSPQIRTLGEHASVVGGR